MTTPFAFTPSYFPISQVVEDAVIDRLSDTTSGLVPVLGTMAKAAGINLPDLDLTPDGQQLFRARISIEEFLDLEDYSFPSLFVYVAETEDMHRIKGLDFSGSVIVGIDFFLSTDDNSLPFTLQQMANLYTDAMYHVFGINNCFHLNACNISLNGGLKIGRTRPVKDQGLGWFQALNIGIPLFLN